MNFIVAISLHIWSILAQSLIFGIALTLAVRIALSVLAPANSSTRFAVWFMTLIAVAAMPPVLLVRSAFPGLTRTSPTRTAAPARIVTHLTAPPSAGRATPTVSAPVAVVARSGESEPWFQTKLFLPGDAAAGILSIYCFLVALLMARLGISYLRLRRLKSRTTEAPPELLERFAMWCSLCETGRPVRLLLSTNARSPMAVGFNRPAIIIPDSLLLHLKGEELDHLGLHELAHMRRYDDWTNLAQRVIRAALFFHPAIHWLCRKLDFEREVACDDWVLTLSGAAKPYARSLTKVLEFGPWRRGPVLASGAVFRKRQIFRRIEIMLDSSRDSRPGISSVSFIIILLCVLGAFTQVLHLPALIAFANDMGGSHQRSVWSTDGHRIELQTRGEVQYGENDMVESISPDGSLNVSESGWTRRKLEVRPGTATPLEIRYLVDGREHAFDERAREWAAATMAFVIRETGTNAEMRALRILEKRGSSGLFDEIERIGNDNSREKYLSSAIESGKLNSEYLRRAAMQANRIGSDHDKAELLLKVASYYRSEQLRGAYFDAVNTIRSDDDRRRVLTQAVEDAGGDVAVLALVGRSVEKMTSDHDKAEMLQLPALRPAINDPAARRALLKAVGSINSDNDKANVLASLLGPAPLAPEMMEDVLGVAAKVNSDHEKSQLLTQVAQQGLTQPAQQAAFFLAANTIHAENDRAEVLKAFIDRDVSTTISDELARSIEMISASQEKCALLIKLAAKPATPAFLKAVQSVNGDNEKRGVIAAMLERANSVEAAKAAVALAATIGSDHDKSEVLLAAASRYGSNPEVREAVRKAAEKISSDSDYRRVVSSLLATSGETAPKRAE